MNAKPDRQAVHTTCPYCGVGCGVVASATSVKGDSAHPSNHGRLCSKGAALAETLDNSERLTAPTIDGKIVDWDTALDLVAQKFADTIAEYGPDSVAFYVSGQCLTEDYYVANKLMKGFIGSGNIDSNSRLCMASSVAGHVRTFGEDLVPGIYEDWDEADLVVFVGSNAAWCHPVLHQRALAARAARHTKIIVIDPRRTSTADAADLHLPIAPGSDVMLFNGLLVHLEREGKLDIAWLINHVSGSYAALRVARKDAPDVDTVALACGLDAEAVQTFYEWFAATENVLTVFSQGVNQSCVGTDKVNAIINCHLATGRIGRPGMGPFSVTGQPNAMGGREVGGLANQLAAHLKFADPQDRAILQEFWASPTLAPHPGLKAVDLFEAVLQGSVRAIWIVATNPAASMPQAGRVREALQACRFLVVSDCWPTDTTQYADVVLPAASWGEKDGTVTSSERRISRQRPFRAPPGQARPDWWQFAQVARRMGFAAEFSWQNPAAVFREHAALSGHKNDGRRVFDISALATLDDSQYDALHPIRWPLPAGSVSEGGRLFANGRFPTKDGRARLVPTPYLGRVRIQLGAFVLNTGRVRDQWHTMTRTGRTPTLIAHTSEPLLAMHPLDAIRIGVKDGDMACVNTEYGAATLRVELRHAQRHGEIFAPMHWTDSFAAMGPVTRLVSPRTDPHSGQPDLKSTHADVVALDSMFYGILIRRDTTPPPALCHWVRVPVENGQVFRLTGFTQLPEGLSLQDFAAALLGETRRDWLEMSDARRGVLRVAVMRDGILHACLMLARNRDALPSPGGFIKHLGEPISPDARIKLLAGRGAESGANDGPRICACFGVGRDAIRHAVVTHHLRSTAEIGASLRAGTNCGSCLPELEEILREVRAPAD